MTSIALNLPAPQNDYSSGSAVFVSNRPVGTTSNTLNSRVPSYGQRNGFIPRSIQDYGDGGAYPEIHVVQYPLNMGRPGKTSKVSGVLSEEQNIKSIVKYQAEVRLMKPSSKEIDDNTESTKLALQKILQGKITAAKKSTKSTTENMNDAKYIRYTPTDAITNEPKQQRIIRMVEAPVDPLEPPKFKHKKVPAGPPSPPAPVLHSPPRKISAKDQLDWKIPPCVSNWKNAKGYTIPLDKRLAADGRGLLEPVINDKFAEFAEAMQVAYNVSRESVKDRNKLANKLKAKEKEDEEDRLRKIAQEAREKRSAGVHSGVRTNISGGNNGNGEYGRSEEEKKILEKMSKEEREEFLERERIRFERTKEREKDMRLEAKGIKSKTTRDHERDISEKIALGIPIGKGTLNSSRYDERLFNQSSGIDSGFANDDDYDLYSKPLFAEKNEGLFKPHIDSEYGEDNEKNSEELYNKLKNSSKFVPDKSFSGTTTTDSENNNNNNKPRNRPVEFEYDVKHEENEEIKVKEEKIVDNNNNEDIDDDDDRRKRKASNSRSRSRSSHKRHKHHHHHHHRHHKRSGSNSSNDSSSSSS